MAQWFFFAAVVLLVSTAKSLALDFDKYPSQIDLKELEEEPSPLPSPAPEAVTRTTAAPPLRCYWCLSWAAKPLESCLTPNKNNTNVTECASQGSQCFTTQVKDALHRGCRLNCTAGNLTTCCGKDLCNDQPAELTELTVRRAAVTRSKSDKPLAPSVLFFVTVLLLLQTVVKVAFV